MFYLKNEEKQIKVFLLIMLIIFFAVCVFTGLYYNDKLLLGSFENFNNDDVKYIRSAKTLLETGKFTYNYPDKSTVFIMPGIVLTLTPFVKLFGMFGAVIAFRIFSAAVQTFTIYIIFLIARKIFNCKIAVLTLIFNFIYIPNIYIPNLILTETMFLLFLSLLILTSIYAVFLKNIKYYIAGGVFLGLAILFRPSIALFPIIIFILWCKKKYTFKEMFKFSLIASFSCLLILSPWWIRNYIIFNKFIVFTLSSGNPMLQGAFVNNNVDHELIAKLNTENLSYTDNEVLNNEIESKMAKKVYKYYFKNNFWEYLRWNTVGKTFLNFASPYYGINLYGISYKYVLFQHLVYMALGTVGIFHIKSLKGLIIVLIPIYFALVHLPFLAYSRYMYPVCPYIIMLMSSIFIKEVKNNEEDSYHNSCL